MIENPATITEAMMTHLFHDVWPPTEPVVA